MHPPSPAAAARQTLQTQRQAVQSLRAGATDTRAFLVCARDAEPLLSALPPRYSDVWQQLLDRLESAALFTEESCSFSQGDLLTHLTGWLDKAEGQLAAL